MEKGILGLRFISLAAVCGLFWSAQGQDCDSNLGSTTFKASGEAASWQYYDFSDVSTNGPSGISLTSDLQFTKDLTDFESPNLNYALTSNSFKLNAQVADETLKSGKDYDPDTLMFKDMDGDMLVVNHLGNKQAGANKKLFTITVPNAKEKTEFTVKYTLCNVLNPDWPGIKKYDLYNSGIDNITLNDISIGVNPNEYGQFEDGGTQSSHDYSQKGAKLTVMDGCVTYTYTSTVPAGSKSLSVSLITGYNATIPFAIKDVEVTGCFSPRAFSPSGDEICTGEQVSLTLDRNYGNVSVKWEKSTDGGNKWETLSTTAAAREEITKSTMYRAFVDGQESNTLSIKTIDCCVVNGAPASRKVVYEENYGYFTAPYTHVDTKGNVHQLTKGDHKAHRTSLDYDLPYHDMDWTGSVEDGSYAVLVPNINGFSMGQGEYDINSSAGWFTGVTNDHTSILSGIENSACLFINVNNTVAVGGGQGYKGPVFEYEVKNLCEDKELNFECYIANLDDPNRTDSNPEYSPLVTINLLSATTNEIIASQPNVQASLGGGWIKCEIKDFKLKNETSVIMQIVADCGNRCDDVDFWRHGNDLLIDDIKFMTCSPPEISAYYKIEDLTSDTTVCSGADLIAKVPVTNLLWDFFMNEPYFVLQYSIDKENWKHLKKMGYDQIEIEKIEGKDNKIINFNFNSDDITKDFNDPEKIYMRVVVAQDATAEKFVNDPGMVSTDDNCVNYSISEIFTVTIDCPTCTASGDIEIISSEKAVVENKKKTIHLCKGESVTLNSNDVTSTTEKGDPYSNFLMTWSLDGVAKTPTPGAVADELVISWEDATEKGLSVKLTSEDADYPGQTGCMKEAEIIIIADPVPDAEFRKPKTEFCEGEGKDLVDMELTKGSASDY
ncbi:MAG: hypothetical protein Q4B61_11715, partial [Bacteroidales bacterium]|nr:hypothetical protein [Bacteroidales bacterium]